ncbi:tape measure protein [Muribaculum intestinale]|uniref:tape measure protein n=1 Tax=Muribaculum intestinale TaxID=1796646 RepID=UPI0025B63053|nr:tape measure protein [Muribaculum intestinale]
MAEDKLIFPIGFDLEKGVKEAQNDVDGYLRRIANAVKKHPITVKVQVDTKSGLSDTVKAETKRAAKELTGFKKEIAEINRQWNALSAKDRGGEMGARLMARYRELTQEAKGYTSTLGAAVKLEDRLAKQRERSANAATKAAQKTREYNNELRSQDGYISRLVKRLAVYAGFSAIRTFLTSVRDVTAEFELQRVSLGAIIQDQNRANQLFSEIKSFALKSPLKILDLTKYVKQVAAYRIETDKLFDTTKRLADVSVGLGVDMGRLVLAYGQVKAASYLRAAEIRQFTEAGIPMLELLAEKFTELQGKAVSTEQVMDMVSKRAVSFSMVEDIFNDMTSAGGMFYNMQEKQAQTLFGMWSKLGDAAAIMYEEIGNTGWVNEGMKEAIRLLESMMRNWRGVASAVRSAGFAFVAIKGNYTIMKLMQVNTIAAAAATRNYARAQEQLNAAKRDGNTLSAKVASLRARAAAANRVAANSTNLWTVANYKLRASLLSLRAAMSANWMGLLLSAIAALVSWFISARQEANRLNNELSKMSAEGAANADAMVRNFERLANAVVESADGSKKQHEALEELKRTYSDIIPAQNLTIEKLRAMKGAYEDVAKAIREKIYQQNLEQQISTIQEDYADKISKGEKKTKELLADYGLDSNEIGRVMGAINKAIDDGLITAEDTTKNRMAVIGKIVQDQTGKTIQTTEAIYRRVAGSQKQIFVGTRVTNAFNKLSNAITKIAKPTEEMNAKIKEQEEYMKGLTGTLEQYTKEWERVQKEIADNKIIAGPEDSQFLVSKQNDNNKIKSWASSLKNVLGDAWDDAFVSLEESVGEKGDKMSYILFDKLMAPEVFEKLSYAQQQYIKRIQEGYNNIIPQDRTVASMRNALERIALQTGVSMDEMKRHLMNSGESWEDYSKRIRDSIKEYESEIDKMTKSNAAVANGNGALKTYTDEEIKKAGDYAEALKLLLPFLQALTGGRNGSGRQSNPRLQNLKEEISLVQKLYNEYKQLERQEGATKAAEDMRRMAGGTLDMFKEKYNIDLPTDAKDLTSALEILYAKMAQLPKKIFPALDKDLKELRWTIEKVDIDESQKNIEAELKRLADRISRTKTAREFYEKILSKTGDIELAANLSLSIYGENGEDLDKAIRDNIQATLGKDKKGIDLDFSAAIRADGSVDYNALEKIAKGYLDMGDISEDTYNKILKMRDEDRKDLAKTVEGWLKATEKAKSYSDKLLDLRRKTQTEIDRINKEEARGNITPEVAESQRSGFLRKEAEEIAKLQYEAFKDSPMYVQMFDDLDNASTRMLENMKSRMEALKGEWQNLSPTQLKELQSRMNEIDAQLAKRNPFKTLASSIKEYRRMMKEGDSRGNKSAGAADQALIEATRVADEARKKYDELVKKYGEGSKKSVQEVIDAKNKLDDAMANEEAAQKAVNEWKKLKDQIGGAWKQADALTQSILSTATQIKDAFGGFGSDADNQYFDDMVSSFGNLVGGITNIGEGIASGNPISIIQGIGGAISGIVGLFTAGKVRRANKEIERQQELLDQLEYTYGRLENAADKLFGADHLNNYNQQIKNLEAQQAAYLKQAEAERSKGKKADKDKIKDYENQARDTANAIKELQDDLVAHFTGSSRTDVARQMAQSWIDARVSMSDTFAAIKSDYSDMIKNMIVEGAAARVIENALAPVWDNMEKMLANNDIDGAIDSLVNGMDAALTQANNGMEVLWKALEARGYDMKQLIGDVDSEYTGIAKNIAGATSEEINTAAAIGNTIMYHTSHLPIISENVAAMRMLMERGTTTTIPEATAVGWTDWQQQAMDNYNAIARNTAETVAECRRSAAACEAFASDIHRMIEFSGGKHRLNVKL